ncbi:ADP-ribosylglycohydrolase family protein [Sphingomonas faeni]|uniref:ADP-ribosylglycohydrolase family protein n=1 Tax=Sphingomonas faeni TaxID=185950 RepID=UPI002413B550|nr:ADP-ribosylglycohydrolase family protein [Sphingomonas faeni]
MPHNVQTSLPAARARTSASHPLQIAGIAAGPGLGRVGITFCPGKCQPHAATGAWVRDLATDIAAIADWGAASVVTLVEDHELIALNVTRLGETVRAAHMEWHHLPIRDVSVPTSEFEIAWQKAGPALRDQLRAGFDVLVHCKGGLGRAGMIASRLLVDSGWQPQAALTAVRAARPGAVETPAQEAYVLGLTVLPEPVPKQTPSAIRDRCRGTLLGLAVGDAIGTTLEFSRRDSGVRVDDMVGGGPFGLQPGEWTDDTAMALALADSLAADASLDAHDVMLRFVAWWQHGDYSCTGRCFDIGITTREALARFKLSGDPYAGSIDPMSAGNGSLMRLAPVAIRHWQNRGQLADIAARQSRTTHAAPEAVAACVVYADMLADALSGMSKHDVLSAARSSTAPVIAGIVGGSWRGKPRQDMRSSGYVAHSLEAALWCIGRTSSFASAVLLAANLGDDADTTAAITGQLAGALYGASGIPEGWLERLAWRDRLTVAADALVDIGEAA